MRSVVATLLALSVLGVAACGSDNVDTATYTCGDFNKSLRIKGDNSSGNFINQLRKDAKLGQDEKTERREITIGIIFACRGHAPSTKPADKAIAAAKLIKTGKFKVQQTPKTKKKSGE